MTNPKNTMPLVAVVMGSKSDELLMQPALDMLQELGIPFRGAGDVCTPHSREDARVCREGPGARDRGHDRRSRSRRPPPRRPGQLDHAAGDRRSAATSDLKGMDSLLAMVQMPGGVPVAVVAIGSAGAKNAALLAAQMLVSSMPR